MSTVYKYACICHKITMYCIFFIYRITVGIGTWIRKPCCPRGSHNSNRMSNFCCCKSRQYIKYIKGRAKKSWYQSDLLMQLVYGHFCCYHSSWTGQAISTIFYGNGKHFLIKERSIIWSGSRGWAPLEIMESCPSMKFLWSGC